MEITKKKEKESREAKNEWNKKLGQRKRQEYKKMRQIDGCMQQ